ncbi:MAG: histidine phosphatase family protein [Flavobacteriaceae bacterium]|jgi:probable phosphoglycerate mutase|nr:histidine phosphatase family protein [Flavobacteriaceae bacterium]
MSSKIIFYIVRHGKTILNTLGRVQGWSDSPLTEEGIKAAEYLGKGLREIRFDSAYISDLRRTRQTVRVILEYQGQKNLSVVEEEGFREACFGSYESDFNRTMWREAALYLRYANGQDLLNDVFNREKEITYEQVVDAIKILDQLGIAENFEQVKKRTQKALLQIADRESRFGEERNVLVVAHGMCITLMLQNWGGRQLLEKDLDNASVCKVIFENGKFTVESMGDMSYVQKGMKEGK